MIPIGTVCYLTGDHSRAGQCCTVTGPLEHRTTFRHKTRQQWSGFGYRVLLASGEPSNSNWVEWFAAPDELIPITPPGLTTDEDNRVPVAA